MRALMGLIKHSHGVSRIDKVPKDPQNATARIRGNGKAREAGSQRARQNVATNAVRTINPY
jgi:hypothetical protein